MIQFFNHTLGTHSVVMCPEAPAYAVLALPNGDMVTFLEPLLTPSGNTHAACPVVHFRVDSLSTWSHYLVKNKVPVIQEPLRCNGVEW